MLLTNSIFGHQQSANQTINQKTEPNLPANILKQVFKIITCHRQRQQKTAITIPISIMIIQSNPNNKFDKETLQ